MELINLFLYISLTILIGFNILRLITFNKDGLYFPEVAALSLGIGIGFIALQMLLYYFLNIKFGILTIIIPWAALPILNSLLFKKRAGFEKMPGASDERGIGHKALNLILSAGIIFEISYAFFRALVRPIESYDAVAIYAIKSKIFFLAKSIPQGYFSGLGNIFPHPDYPLNIPLFQSFIYLALSSLNDQLVKVIYPLYFLAILALLYCAIRRFAKSTYALLFTFVLASMPQFNAYAANAYLDLPLAFYCFASAIFLFRWFEEKGHARLLVISAVMAGLAGWTKNEGLLYCAVGALIILMSGKIRGAVLYAVIIALILAPWIYIKKAYGLVNTDVGEIGLNPLNLLRQIGKLGPIFYEFQRQVFGPKKWNIFWIAALAAFILNFRKSFSGILKFVTIFLALTVSGYIFIYLISPIDIIFFLKKTWSRFLVQFLPIAVYWLALVLREDEEE